MKTPILFNGFKTLAVLLCSVWCGASAVYGSGYGWAGLAGASLKHAVAMDCLPQEYLTVYMSADGIWELLKQTDADENGSGYIDRFSGNPLGFAPSLWDGPPDAVPVNVVEMSWWKPESGLQFGVVHDLYNIYLSRQESVGQKLDYAPGTVVEKQFDNGVWSVGYGFLDGVRRMLWNPPTGFEGDVARVVMYMLTVYGDGLITFGGYGGVYVSSEYYPGINEGALRQLLVWHRSDPVDDLERRRNAEFSKRQGNRNPFVDYPALAEYLWGEMRGLPFECEARPDKPGASARMPLKARYSMSEPIIDLYHAAVPEGAVWSVDGMPVEGDGVVPAEIGLGMHELKFMAPGAVGKVTIEVVP